MEEALKGAYIVSECPLFQTNWWWSQWIWLPSFLFPFLGCFVLLTFGKVFIIWLLRKRNENVVSAPMNLWIPLCFTLLANPVAIVLFGRKHLSPMGFFQGCGKGGPMIAHGCFIKFVWNSKQIFISLRKHKGMESTQLLKGKEAQWGAWQRF